MSKIRKLHNLLREKKISCEELTRKYIDEIATVDKNLNSYVLVTEKEAIDCARSVDKKISRNEDIDLLEGIPMTLKDNILTRGIKTTCCSKILSGYVPAYDATIYKILKSKNAVLLGKTNMDEFAMGSSCRTSAYGGAKNPFNLTRVAGGSSGGGAAAVGANLAVYAIGSDTGGSIREPAAFCGVVGLKPTYGSISRYGIIAYASSLDQAGPITSTVEDAAIVYDALSIQDPLDSTSRGKIHDFSLESLKNEIGGVKIGIVEEYFDGANADVHNRVQDAIRLYEKLGARVVHLSMPQAQNSLKAYYVQSCVEAASNFARFDGIRFGNYNFSSLDLNAEDFMTKVRSQGFGDEVKRRVIFGTYISRGDNYKKYHLNAQNAIKGIRAEFDNAFSQCDVLISPTATKTAFSFDYEIKDPVEGYKADICTVPVNMLGLCAISIPCGVGNDKLPVGLQIIGNKFCESRILNLAYNFEQNFQWSLPKMGVLV